ncbi:MAG: DUF58 domain-containing protein [Cyanobacteriota bacterium]|nr:DUF58 domain-containing protein [Cyanobacteriota bacterium]
MDLLKRLDPRLPPRKEPRLRLGLRTLYILPTGLGWLWLGGIGLLLVVGVQTQTNGPLLLAFLMLGLWLLALHLTHFNLHGLEVACGTPSWGFAEETLPYPLLLRCAGLCEGLRLHWVDAGGEPLAPGSLRPGEHQLELPWRPTERGWRQPGRLRLLSTAPLGLFVCWTVWHPPAAQLIVPARKAGPVKELVDAAPAAAGRGRATRLESGGDDWHDLRPRRPEDSPSRLAWKLLAQGRGHQVKRFAATAPQALVIAADPSLPRERAFQHLSERLCRLHRLGLPFGLLWQGAVVGPDEGLAHRDRCLLLLAEAP